ncbi:methionyl-tRNA formyltransferase [Sciscionella sediminilitoris]|uniref:methionyl-tRNA formyltransferase n=1 Tax=Sciscionella sediminilitoris TaxID=1445613 RepID=UPI0004DED278|nr:methionyl-tRNA formyltransferase [Sciscionella sp. SE31]
MRVAMFGYQTWGHRTLSALLGSEHEVVLVVTHPRSEHAYEKIWSDSVAELAEEHQVPVHIAQRPTEETVQALRDAAPDIIVANNWRTWIPREIFDLPPRGTLNVHDSLLPAYAGFAPLVWALINGEPEVGVTAHMMNEELDAGDVVLQRSVAVGPRDTASDLVLKTVDLIGPIVVDALAQIEAGTAVLTPQDRSKASFFHKRAVRDSRIDWTWPAEDLDRLVRAQADPYPNAFTTHNGATLRITEAEVSTAHYGGTPGRVFVREGEGIVIVAGPQARSGHSPGLKLLRVRTEDGTEHAAVDYFKRMGDYLGD